MIKQAVLTLEEVEFIKSGLNKIQYNASNLAQLSGKEGNLIDRLNFCAKDTWSIVAEINRVLDA